MKINATIQARISSERLPGKVLREAGGQPLLLTLVRRLMRSDLISGVIVATSNTTADNEIVRFCEDFDIPVYRGSESDVLARIVGCLQESQVDVHVECFGDSPLVEPTIVDRFLEYFLANQAHLEFLSPSLELGPPIGLDFNIFAAKTLSLANKLVRATDELREHAGFNITRFPDRFRCATLPVPNNLRGHGLSVEVDYPEDLELIQRLFEQSSRRPEDITVSDILAHAKLEPQLYSRSSKLPRRWREVQSRTAWTG